MKFMYDHLYIGVRNIEESLRLWRDVLGFSDSHRPAVDCRALETLWGLKTNTIDALVLLNTPSAPCGRVMLVDFAETALSVREGAQAFDLCPKNLDINVVNFHDRVAELKAAGYELRSDPVFYSIEKLEVSEVQVKGCDDVNVVLTEIVGETLALTPRQFGGVTSVVTIVNDIKKEADFYHRLGFGMLDSHQLKGEKIEKMISLPKGASLNMQLLGNSDHRFGRAELIKYEKASGNNLYPKAAPPAIGFFRGAVIVGNLQACVDNLPKKAINGAKPTKINYLDRQYLTQSVSTPSGFNIDLLEPYK
jgi:catechol 2,3-dioxygenase-like lactoylglutathione lyase family enzyme